MAQTTGGPLPVTAAFTRPGQAVARWLRGEIRTTPGRLRLWSIVVLIVTALTALLGVNALGARRRVAADLRNDRAAFLFDTQGLHTALLKADAESANAFLAGGIEPADRRKGYEDAVADAAARLATAAQRADTADARVSIGKISQLLPVYTGLIESARANNRQGFPAGGAYLRAASKKLRAEIVPLVEDVEQIALDRFRAKYADLSGGAAVALASLMVGLVLLLAWLQLWLFRRTNRVLNPPLVAATVLVVVSLVSVLGTMARQRVDARDAVREGFRPALLSAEARVQGFTAKADESLALVARGNDEAYRASYETAILEAQHRISQVQIDRASLVSVASASINEFKDLHASLTSLADAGDYGAAVRAAVSDSKGSANAAFTRFDADTDSLLNFTNTRFKQRMGDAANRMRVLRWLLPLVVIVAGALALAGIQLRRNEYR